MNDFILPKFEIPKFEPPQINIPIDKSKFPAWWTRRAILEYIGEFEEWLDRETEVWMHLVSFWNTYTFHLQDIESEEPSMIIFFWVNEKWEQVRLIQNLAQLNIFLIWVKKIWEEARRIWFNLPEN